MTGRNAKRGPARRLLAFFLAAAILVTAAPDVFVPQARAAESWVQGYLDKLVEWGVMRGDQEGNLDPDRNITRAEFVTMINRAFGYGDVGEVPFKDVSVSSWYYDDIGIAYDTGYFNGTSQSSAEPDAPLSREQAAVILGRNLMLRESAGEVTEFTDGRNLSDWSRGMVKTAAQYGVVKGYPDGTFLPQNNITRGEVASLLVSAIGTPVNAPGDYTLGAVYGNVTVSSSGVTLRNTTIAGDLYITAGVGLGYTTLENVKVLGRIIASGAGESNKGESSIILRNVDAAEMVVDSPSNQFVTVRAEGDTVIASTSVRTPTYLEDNTDADSGYRYIELDGEEGTSLELSGNIKEVVTITPRSSLTLARGTAKLVTVDEKAVNSTVNIANGAVIETLNLDVGTTVTGTGDIETLNVNASGCTVSMLPGKINIRPGITANIGGQTMDSSTALEYSQDPRLLSGYPQAADVAPTSFNALFSTNKRGTVYWAVSSLADGSIGEEDLISPPSYATKILKSGRANVNASGTENTTKVTGLTSDGSYYLSAVLVDERGERSPVKVISLTTPDDSVPAFASGFPYMSKITNTTGQVTVMATKSCQMYYAVLPKGAAAPTADDFKTNSITGNYGYGSIDLTKNVSRTLTVNDKPLEELESYDLYLWLTDADGGRSASVRKVSFTTVDKTPPVFLVSPTVNSVQAKSIGFTFTLNEDGTVYWVAVKEGTEYPKRLNAQPGESGAADLASDEAKLQVATGMNGLKSGKVTARENRETNFTVSGLDAETSYDIYYLAEDKAGNYSVSVAKVTANTLDNIPPTVEQSFTRYNGTDTETPLADTDIVLTFSEGVKQSSTNTPLVQLYDNVKNAKTDHDRNNAKEAMAKVLRETIWLYTYSQNDPLEVVPERTWEYDDTTVANPNNWIIDYRNAQITMDEGKTVVTFPTTSDANGDSALNLRSGGTYYFEIHDIADTSSASNPMGVTKLEKFRTVFASVSLSTTNISTIDMDDPQNPVTIDMSFQIIPLSTEAVDDSIDWDMLIWMDTTVKFNLYERITYRGNGVDPNGLAHDWQKVGGTVTITPTGSDDYVGRSLVRDFRTGSGQTPTFGQLNEMNEDYSYEYAISFTEIEGLAERGTWSQRVNAQISVAAGGSNSLGNLAENITPGNWDTAQEEDGITSIGLPEPFTMRKQFSDRQAPTFIDGYPNLREADDVTHGPNSFEIGDTFINMSILLDRPGTVYWVVAPVGAVNTVMLRKEGAGGDVIYTGGTLSEKTWDELPLDGSETEKIPTADDPILTKPGYLDIINPNFASQGSTVKSGSAPASNVISNIEVTGLQPEQKYCVYFVLKGTAQIFSPVYCYRFETTDVNTPILTLNADNPYVNVSSTGQADIDYVVMPMTNLPGILGQPFNKYAVDTDAAPLPSAYKADSYTVLSALLEQLFDSKNEPLGSVFDKYATTSAKESVAQLIRGAQVEGRIILKGSTSVTGENDIERVNCQTDSMQKQVMYCFLAVGRHPLGTTDAFQAVQPVFLPDNTPPRVISARTTIESNLPAVMQPNTKVTGTLTLLFDEPIYYFLPQTETSEQVLLPITAGTDSGKGAYMPIMNAIRYSAGKSNLEVVDPPSKPGYVTSITFRFTQTYHGVSLILFDGGANLSDAVPNPSQPLELTFDSTLVDANGKPAPKFTYDTEIWGGTYE